jgi:replicative DNA helicase
MDQIKLNNNSFLDKGKLPPQSVQLEEAILGAMINYKVAQDEAFMVINSPDVFYKDNNKLIFEAIQNLYNEGNPVDLLTVSNKLKSIGKLESVGGDMYLIGLSQRTSSAAHVEYHSRIVLQSYMKRQVIMFSSQNIALAYDESVDVFDLLRGWQKAFDSLADSIATGRSTMSFPAALDNLKHEIELLTANKEEVQLVGIDTGFKRLNKYTGGYRNQNLIIIAARPGMGKTSYVLKMIIENAKKNISSGFISLEMSVEELTARAVAIDTNFHLSQLIKKGFEHSEYFTTFTSHQERMKDYPIYIDDAVSTDVSDIVVRAKQMARKNDIKYLVIDYIQLMTDKSIKGNRESEVSAISRRLKRLAKELNIPVIVLSQLSRSCEQRGSSKRPILSDLRDSGSIEQDADMVQFIYRPEYYNIEMIEDEYDPSMSGLIAAGANTEIIIAKYRSGSTNTTLLKWVGDKTKFVDVEDFNDKVDYIDNQSIELPKINPNDAFADSNDTNVDEFNTF